MSLFSQLTNKPWEQEGTNRALPGTGEGALEIPAQKVALRTLIAVLCMMFTLFITAYFVRMDVADWRPLPEPNLLWLNTAILFFCSVAMQWTRNSVNNAQPNNVRLGLVLGGVLTIAFIVGQLFAWQEINAAGYPLYSNPANAFFYLLTGLHGLHLLGGLWVWTKASIKVWFGGEVQSIRLSVELCTTYWHFLLLLWLVIFAVLSYT